MVSFVAPALWRLCVALGTLGVELNFERASLLFQG